MRAADRLAAALSRVTSSGRFVPEIDGLRFVAIASVVLFHAHSYFLAVSPDASAPARSAVGTLLRLGWFGVPLFFAISGYILAVPFARARLRGERPPPLTAYYTRRLTRLEPPYLVCALLLGILLLCGGWPPGDLARHTLASAFYVHWFAYHEMSPINAPTWTLEIEVQFYLAAPLLASVFSIRRTALRRAILSGATLLAAAQSIWWRDEFLFRTLPGQIQFFLIGFLLADLDLVAGLSSPVRRVGWDVAGLLAWAAIPTILILGGAVELALPAAILAAYVAAFRGRWLNRLFRTRWIVVIGGMCYTIYLYHTILINRVKAWIFGDPTPGFGPGAFLALAVVLAGVLVSSAVLFVAFEKPFMHKDWPARTARWFRARWAAPAAP